MNALDVTVLQVLGRSAGGIARHVAEITDALDSSAGLEIGIAAPPDLPVKMPKEIHALRIPDGPIRGHRSAIKELRSIVSSTACDVVHAHGLRAGIDSAVATHGLNVPVILTVHNLVRPEIAGALKAPFFRRAESLATRTADRVLCVSEQIARHLRGSVGSAAAKIEVLYLGIEDPPRPERPADEVRAEAGAGDPETRLIVSVSRLSAQKALHVLLDALRRLPAAVLAVVGEGPLEDELKARARSLGVADRTRFLGFRDDAHEFIAAADVFCLSSIWEGIPLAAQEAIALGTSVVATDVGGMSELIRDGHSGRLCSPNDVSGLAAALDELLTDRDLSRRYAEVARSELKERFSRPRMLERLSSIYKEAALVP